MRKKPERKVEKDAGLIMAMASEMATCLVATRNACVLFKALAGSAGVDVTNAFKDAEG